VLLFCLLASASVFSRVLRGRLFEKIFRESPAAPSSSVALLRFCVSRKIIFSNLCARPRAPGFRIFNVRL
jgi:hypothetical protein